MLIGSRSPLCLCRCFIHSASPQSYFRSQTTDAVLGGTSLKKANGSALSTRYPFSRAWTWYLYAAPGPTPGTNPTQMPLDPWGSRRVADLFQPLKSPKTYTFSAPGA